eukprot:1181387-Prorocentrum_minimum.AAC.6
MRERDGPREITKCDVRPNESATDQEKLPNVMRFLLTRGCDASKYQQQQRGNGYDNFGSTYGSPSYDHDLGGQHSRPGDR